VVGSRGLRRGEWNVDFVKKGTVASTKRSRLEWFSALCMKEAEQRQKGGCYSCGRKT